MSKSEANNCQPTPPSKHPPQIRTSVINFISASYSKHTGRYIYISEQDTLNVELSRWATFCLHFLISKAHTGGLSVAPIQKFTPEICYWILPNNKLSFELLALPHSGGLGSLDNRKMAIYCEHIDLKTLALAFLLKNG